MKHAHDSVTQTPKYENNDQQNSDKSHFITLQVARKRVKNKNKLLTLPESISGLQNKIK